MNPNMNLRAEPPAVSQRWRYLLPCFLSCRCETRPVDKTRASPAVSDNGKEEEEEEEEEEAARSKEKRWLCDLRGWGRGSHKSLIFPEGPMLNIMYGWYWYCG